MKKLLLCTFLIILTTSLVGCNIPFSTTSNNTIENHEKEQGENSIPDEFDVNPEDVEECKNILNRTIELQTKFNQGNFTNDDVAEYQELTAFDLLRGYYRDDYENYTYEERIEKIAEALRELRAESSGANYITDYELLHVTSISKEIFEHLPFNTDLIKGDYTDLLMFCTCTHNQYTYKNGSTNGVHSMHGPIYFLKIDGQWCIILQNGILA